MEFGLPVVVPGERLRHGVIVTQSELVDGRRGRVRRGGGEGGRGGLLYHQLPVLHLHTHWQPFAPERKREREGRKGFDSKILKIPWASVRRNARKIPGTTN